VAAVKLMRIGPVGAERPAVLTEEGRVLDLGAIIGDITGEFNGDVNGAFLASGGIDRVRAAVAAGTLPEFDGADGRIGAPIARPGKIVCIGLNYLDHARETGQAAPENPVVFMKAPNTMVGPNDTVLIPRGSVKTDWEVELAVVIGRTARYLEDREQARDVIAGYAVSNDVSEREFQLERSPQWDLGKSCETFNPLGPWLVPADEVADPGDLGLRLSVNGTVRQNGATKNMIFDVPHLVWYLSQYMVLEPGDVINTGTPAGVALGLPDHPYLRAGDTVRLEIDGLGSQTQTFVQA
jgi:2-keto-4-pentenoate hydratase/2-oxohepta-3-ene-1,7-dioic acid hydratase in catechol pathway